MNHDVIVVGARCAGAALATFTARSGLKTLLLDAHAMPSDMPLSTHFLHQPGMQVLDELGVGAGVRARTPATRRYRTRVDEHEFHIDLAADKFAWCPRRSLLDPLLLEAAQAAGAELRDRTRVIELVQENGRVEGVVVESPRGRETLRARLTVGADGRQSTIAKLAGVEEYLSVPSSRSAYWFYIPTPALWREDPAYADCAFLGWEGDGMRYIFQCDGDVLIMVCAPPAQEVEGWRGHYLERAQEYFRGSPVTRPVIEGGTPIGKGLGMLKAHWFCRRPVGPGFALVGDAGEVKDYVTGHGMTDALIGAKRLHAAILRDSESAYERYWRERDVETLPLFFDALMKGDVGFNDRFTQMLFANLKHRPDLAARIAAVQTRDLDPLDAFSTGELMGMVGKELLRGRFGILGPFMRAGQRMAGYKKAVAHRRQLLRALDAMPTPLRAGAP